MNRRRFPAGLTDADNAAPPDPPRRVLAAVQMSTVEPAPVRFVWPGRIALGKCHLIVGHPGVGKSFLTASLAAVVSRGASWPDGGTAPQGRVLLLSGEDSAQDTILPRLMGMDADLSQIHVVDGVDLEFPLQGTGEEVEVESFPFRLDIDLRPLEEYIEALGGVRLVVIDPITEYLGKTNANDNAEVRRVLLGLGKLAERRQCAIVSVTHLNKNGRGLALSRAIGSLAFIAQSRIAHAVMRDPNDPARILLLNMKNNLGPQAAGLAYRLAEGRLEWEPGELHADPDHVLAGNPLPGPSKIDQIIEQIDELLRPGPLPVAELDDRLKQAGFAEVTIKRAKAQRGLIYQQENRRWWASLPEGPPP